MFNSLLECHPREANVPLKSSTTYTRVHSAATAVSFHLGRYCRSANLPRSNQTSTAETNHTKLALPSRRGEISSTCTEIPSPSPYPYPNSSRNRKRRKVIKSKILQGAKSIRRRGYRWKFVGRRVRRARVVVRETTKTKKDVRSSKQCFPISMRVHVPSGRLVSTCR